MRFERAFLPAGGYWSSPFAKWQGKLASLHTLGFAADVARKALHDRGVPPADFDHLVLGTTVPSRQSFYGAPWLAGMIGAPGITGSTIAQACATSVACLVHAAARIECGGSRASLVVTADKTSNGPHLYYPDPNGPGGKGEAEDWVWDAFNRDPWAKNSMIETAENVAREAQISREAQDALALHRHRQYQDNFDSGLYRRYMVTPCEINPSGKRVLATLEGDEGVFPTTREGLAKLKPVLAEGTITFGTQTHPADGNAGLLVVDREHAQAWSRDGGPVQIVAAGEARVEKGYMAKAVVPAARNALHHARLSISDIAVIKTHNPFAVNDIYFAREFKLPAESFNNFGSSLIFGHPQGPTGARLIAEGIEEARLKGGGYVLFAGCAAGDTASAVVLKV